MVAGSSPAGCAMSGFWHKQMQYGGRSSVGRAQDCGSWCRGFDPLRPPHIPENARHCLAFLFKARLADVVKLVDTPDLGSGAARCESSSLSVRTTCIVSRTLSDLRNALKAPSSGLFCTRRILLPAGPVLRHSMASGTAHVAPADRRWAFSIKVTVCSGLSLARPSATSA